MSPCSPRTYYLNADFDLTLRPRPRQVDEPALVRQVRELSAQALIWAGSDDAALLRVEVPDDFLRHLQASGVGPPRRLTRCHLDVTTKLVPFGWSPDAIELNTQHAEPARHPPLECIRRVNARSFGRRLETELFPASAPGAEIRGVADLELFLARAARPCGWVVKSEYGHSGLANRRIRAGTLTPTDRRFVERRLSEDDRLVVERWLARERDYCVVFQVPLDGQGIRIHESVNTSDGAFIGALYGADDDELHAWRPALIAASERIAACLAGEGYFGPVCLDAFTWRDGGRTHLRPLVDLNCREAMSTPAYCLWQRLLPGRTLYFRFFNRRRLDLGDEIGAARRALGQRLFDPARGRGILWASSLRFGLDGDTWRPNKVAVIFAGSGRDDVADQERWFRRRFETGLRCG